MLIVFDWDGTLADSAAHIARNLSSTALTFGLPEPKASEIINGLGLSPEAQLARLFPGYEFDAQEFMRQFREKHRAGLCPGLFDGIRALLQALRDNGALLAVATAMSRSGLDWAIKQNQLEDMFLKTRCAEESAPKPNPQLLFDLALDTGFSVDNMCMVGDTTYDMEMANSANVRAIAVTYGAHNAQQLAKVTVSHQVDSVAALGAVLLALLK